jgi:hypothetical protein
MAWHGMAWHGVAWRGMASQGKDQRNELEVGNSSGIEVAPKLRQRPLDDPDAFMLARVSAGWMP